MASGNREGRTERRSELVGTSCDGLRPDARRAPSPTDRLAIPYAAFLRPSAPEELGDERPSCDDASENKSTANESCEFRSELPSPELPLHFPREAGDRPREEYENTAPCDADHCQPNQEHAHFAERSAVAQRKRWKQYRKPIG